MLQSIIKTVLSLLRALLPSNLVLLSFFNFATLVGNYNSSSLISQCPFFAKKCLFLTLKQILLFVIEYI